MATSEQTVENDSSESSGASDVDSLLGEFDKETKQANKPSGEINEVLSYIRQSQQREVESAIGDTVKTVKGELDIGDDLVRGFIEVQASKDKTISDAFNNRITDPAGWAKQQERLSNAFRKQFPSLDDKATNDTNNLLAAISQSKTSNATQNEAPDFNSMSDSDFFKEVEKIR